MADIAAAQRDRVEFGNGYDFSFIQNIRVCVLQLQLFLYCL